MAVQRPAHQAKRYHHGQVDQLATNNIAVDFSCRFHSPLALVSRSLPFSNVDWLIVTKQQIAGVEKIFALVRGQGKNARIHADSIARAGFDTESADHTAQFIDAERDRVFFYRRIGVFTSLDVNAQGWTRRGTEHTGGAAWRAIFFAHQAMAPAIALRDVGRLFRILLRDRMASPKHVRHKMAGAHCHPPQDFRDIQFLPEGERLHSLLTFVSDRISKIANFGVTETGIRRDRHSNIVQYSFCRYIRPVLPKTLRQARIDLPGRPGLAAWCKRRINALQVALEIGKRAIAFSIRRTRQEHVRLLAPGDYIGRLHNQAIELGAPACHSLGPKRLNQVNANGIQYFDGPLV